MKNQKKQNNQHPNSKQASPYTLKHNTAFAQEMERMNPQDFDNAERGFIAPLPDDGCIKDDTGILLDIESYAFLDDEASNATLNPSLRRQGQLMKRNGLFKVCEGIYQVRGIGSSISIIEGKTGFIVIDSGMNMAVAKAAKDLYTAHRPGQELKAIIMSHPHGDHFGGMGALVDEEDVLSGKIKIYAPKGYLEELYSENLFLGNIMRRRAGYMFGMQLAPGPRSQAGIGIGLANLKGRRKMYPPTDYITHTGQVLTIDGLDFHFQFAKDAEAPVELHWYIPQYKALTLSENCEQTMHNTYTLRGAKIRNPLVWSKVIQEALDFWGDDVEVFYSCHSWPVWGNAAIRKHLELARDAYRYLNDQTLLYANQGMTLEEIGDAIQFPEQLHNHWGVRGHYGSLNHNAKGTYVYYLGWFDGNPVNLDPLPRKKAAPRYVDCMGGQEAVLKNAQKAFDAGEYRWAAELLDHLVSACPQCEEGRQLLADTYEQLGYQAEAAPWRNIYLTGAMELRDGVRKPPLHAEGSEAGLTPSLLCDYLSIRLDSYAAGGLHFTCNITITEESGSTGKGDSTEKLTAYVSNGVISHSQDKHAPQADIHIATPLKLLNKLFFGAITVAEAQSQGMTIEGKTSLLEELLSHRVSYNPWFDIIPGEGE